jgi:hypothetical protein
MVPSTMSAKNDPTNTSAGASRRFRSRDSVSPAGRRHLIPGFFAFVTIGCFMIR